MHVTRSQAGRRDRASVSTTDEERPASDDGTDPAGQGGKEPRRDPVLGIVLAVVAATLLWPILIGLYIYFFH